MSWQDVRHHYEEQDDPPEPKPVGIITLPCPGCGKPVRVPVDAAGDDLCCSQECIAEVCRRMDAEIKAMRKAEVAQWEARLADGPCAKCGRPIRDLPENFQTGCAFCSKQCERARAAELYGDADHYEVPL